MLEERPEIEIDFAGEMQALANQAGAKNAPAAGAVRMERAELTQVIGNLIRPLAEELEALKRGPMREHSVMLAALGKAINAHHTAAGPLEAVAREFKRLESIETEIRRLGSVESANSKLFDALHTELKTYKDNFLFDSLQLPYIRDLVSLFDDLSELHAQLQRRLEESVAKDGDDTVFLRTLAGNIENQIAHMVEVFLRMDVVLSRTGVGAPLDKKTHRTVSVEPAASPDDDATVARSVKPGFSWHERTVRPEDVVVRRWTNPAGSAPAATDAPPATGLIPSPKAS